MKSAHPWCCGWVLCLLLLFELPQFFFVICKRSFSSLILMNLQPQQWNVCIQLSNSVKYFIVYWICSIFCPLSQSSLPQSHQRYCCPQRAYNLRAQLCQRFMLPSGPRLSARGLWSSTELPAASSFMIFLASSCSAIFFKNHTSPLYAWLDKNVFFFCSAHFGPTKRRHLTPKIQSVSQEVQPFSC